MLNVLDNAINFMQVFTIKDKLQEFDMVQRDMRSKARLGRPTLLMFRSPFHRSRPG